MNEYKKTDTDSQIQRIMVTSGERGQRRGQDMEGGAIKKYKILCIK